MAVPAGPGGLRVPAAEPVPVHGRMGVKVFDGDARRGGRQVAESWSDNLIVTTGVSLLAQALNWALVEQENSSWGSPFTNPIAALYGACGTSNTPASAGDIALGAEIGRALVTNGGSAAGLVTIDFFVPTSIGNGTIQELGTFGAAGLLLPQLTSAVMAGGVYTSLSVAQVVGTIPSGSTLTLGYGTGTTQQIVTTAQANVGDSAIAVSSFTASNTFGATSYAAYTPGTMIDHAILGSPVTKTSAQTMIIELALTLVSA